MHLQESEELNMLKTDNISVGKMFEIRISPTLHHGNCAANHHGRDPAL